jgi:hypothetical protein
MPTRVDGDVVLTAVSNGAVVELQDYMVRRWGPRVADLVEAIAVGAASTG